MDITHEELKKAAEPLIEILNKYGSPYTTIIVQQDKIVVTQDVMGIPLPVND